MSGFPLFISSSKLGVADPSNFEIYYPTGMLHTGNWEMALHSAKIWYSWPNISPTYNNDIFRYSTDGGLTYKQLTIPKGTYQIRQINDEIHRQMKALGDFDNTNPLNPVYYVELLANPSTMKLRIEITNPAYRVDLSVGKLCEILGFDPVIVPATADGPYKVDITRGVNALVIRCSAVSGSFDNSAASDAIYAFSPDKPPGSLINIEPINLIYSRVQSSGIFSMRMRLTDQLGRPIDTAGEHTEYVLHVRPVITN